MCLAPNWLDDAYRSAKPADDGGAGARTNVVHALVSALARQGVVPAAGRWRWLDYGSGVGLLAAMLAKDGYEVTAYDPLREGLAEEPTGRYGGASCIEVVEHLLDPRRAIRSISSLLAEDACLLVATNLRPPGVGADWPYLAAELGQHVTFASPRGFTLLVQDSGLRWECSLRPRALPELEVHFVAKNRYDGAAVDSAARAAGFSRIVW